MPPNANLRKLQALVDSDSYGSEDDGFMKAKDKFKPKHGRKKNKRPGPGGGDRTNQNETGSYGSYSDSRISADEDEEAPEIWSKPKTKEEKAREEEAKRQKEREQKKEAAKKKKEQQREAEEAKQISEQIKQATVKLDIAEKNKFNELDSECSTPRAKAVDPRFKEQNSLFIKGDVKADRKGYSPPMIKEYDPNEDNAKIRAQRRREELKKREKVVEVDKTQYPEDPRPWKGKPSEFFIMHVPRKGTHKVLNNSQKEFIMIYYPDTVVDHVSLMDFLYRQSKSHEEKQRNLELEKQGLIIHGKKKKKGFGKTPMPQFVTELKHINEEQKYVRKDPKDKPISFEALLDGDQEGRQNLNSLADQLAELTGGVQNRFIEATLEQEQHSRMQSPTSGVCTHCSHHGDSYLKNQAAVSAISKQVDQQRQQILQQICEAKRRQARMEAEEARRLKDEAIRLAQQAKILELEAQRPLLEAQRLDAEIRLMEQQFGKIFGSGGLLSTQAAQRNAQSIGPAGNSLNDLYGEGKTSQDTFGGYGMMDDFMSQARQQVQQRKDMLIDEARKARFEIAKLQQQTMALTQESYTNKFRQMSAFDRPQPQSDWFAPKQTRDGSTFFPSENSIAARQAIAQANAKALLEKAKREKMEREIAYKEKERQRLLIQKQLEAEQKERERIEQERLIKETRERLERERAAEKRKERAREPKYEDSYYSENGGGQESEDSEGPEEDDEEDDEAEDERWSPKNKKKQASEDEYGEEQKQEEEEVEEEKKREASPVEYKYVPKQRPKDKSPEFQEEKPPEKVKREKRQRRVREKSVSEMSVQEIQYKKYREKEELRKRKQQSSPARQERAGRSPPRVAKREKPSEQMPELDPYIDAADLELERARKLFEKAQRAQQEAHEKKEKLIKKQNDEIAQAQEEAKRYFEEQKRKQQDTVKQQKIIKKKQVPQNQQSDETQGLLRAFNQYINSISEEQTKLKNRYLSKAVCAEFLTPILNGQVVKEFGDDWSARINDYILSDNFAGGHREYFHKWRHLYLYEVYAFLMNSRWSKFTGSEIDLKNQLKAQQREKAMCWRGYFQFKQTEGKFTTLKMLKDPPSIGQYADAERTKNWSKVYDEPERTEGAHFQLSHCREEDLIVISKFRINLEGQDDIKMVSGGTKFLREVLSKQGVMLGYVAKCESKIHHYIEVMVDSKYSNYFQNLADEENSGSNVFMRYCYFFESILTCQREFRALKAVEFTRLCPSITYPSLALEYKEKILEDYANTVQQCFEDLDGGPVMHPIAFEGDGEKAQHQMNNYLIKNHLKFNKSQAKVLEQVLEMPKDEILLIQGPPGTGKTHTIIGIISMLMSSTLANSKQKIMVCAPSNAAIDQIIMRIIEKGLIGMIGLKRTKKVSKKQRDSDDTSSEEEEYNSQDLTQTLIRITSTEYQTESDIKKYTLEQRIIKKLCIEKFGELKKAIKMIKEMIDEMNDYDAWDDNQDFPFVNKVKFKNYTKLIKDAYLKKVDNWGDVNLTRQLQLMAMKNQLQIHEKELTDFKNGQNIEQGNMEWKDAEQMIISEAKIICCTLSMAGSAKLEPFVNSFEYLIIDEACQSTEPSVLIPFALAPKRVILVGDQKQLPATTFSGNSEKTGFCRSLFERLLDSGYDKTMLTIQFRMHPKIRAFPSEQFYGGAITDHQSIGQRSAPLTISNLARVFPERMIFFDIIESEEIYDNKSKCNYEEADFTKLLIDFMARKMSLQGTLKYIQGQIGVISPYKAQVRQLYSRIDRLCADQGCAISNTIEVNTVDAFQGSEKDIIIFNCVRSNYETQLEKSLGFLLDERRLNVAITRPKYFLIVVGNAKTLDKSLIWEDMIEYCKAQGTYIRVNDSSQFENMACFKKYIMPQFML